MSIGTTEDIVYIYEIGKAGCVRYLAFTQQVLRQYEERVQNLIESEGPGTLRVTCPADFIPDWRNANGEPLSKEEQPCFSSYRIVYAVGGRVAMVSVEMSGEQEEGDSVDLMFLLGDRFGAELLGKRIC